METIRIDIHKPAYPHDVSEENEGSILVQELIKKGQPITPLNLDCANRDYTVNALYLDVQSNKIIDPSQQGIPDLKSKTLRAVIGSEYAMKRSPLRILRGLTRVLKENYQPTEELKTAWHQASDQLNRIKEYYRAIQYSRLLDAGDPDEADKLAHHYGLSEPLGLENNTPDISRLHVGDRWQENGNTWALLSKHEEIIRCINFDTGETRHTHRTAGNDYQPALVTLGKFPKYSELQLGDTWQAKDPDWFKPIPMEVTEKIGTRVRVSTSSQDDPEQAVYGPALFHRLVNEDRFINFKRSPLAKSSMTKPIQFRDIDVAPFNGDTEHFSEMLHEQLTKQGETTPLRVSEPNGLYWFAYTHNKPVSILMDTLQKVSEDLTMETYLVGGYVRNVLEGCR